MAVHRHRRLGLRVGWSTSCHRAAAIIRCSWHGREYDLRTGKSWCEPHRARVRNFPVAIEPGRALVEGPYVAETFPIRVEDDYVVSTQPPATTASADRTPEPTVPPKLVEQADAPKPRGQADKRLAGPSARLRWCGPAAASRCSVSPWLTRSRRRSSPPTGKRTATIVEWSGSAAAACSVSARGP